MNLREQPSDIRKSNGDHPTEVVKNVANVLDNEWKIEEIYLSLLNCIEKYIRRIHLNKEYYPNLQDWSNPEIDEMAKLSPYEIWKRLEKDKWIFH